MYEAMNVLDTSGKQVCLPSLYLEEDREYARISLLTDTVPEARKLQLQEKGSTQHSHVLALKGLDGEL